MRITYIHQHFALPSAGGGARPYEFAKRLAGAGHDVTVICAANSSSRYAVEGFRVLAIGARYDNSMGYLRRILAFLHFMVVASIRAAVIPADVVFASSTPLTVAVPGVIAARRQRARFVLEIRDLWPAVPIALGALSNPIARALATWLERFAYANADHVIALSPGMADGVRAVAPSVQVTVVPNTSDLDALPSRVARIDAIRQGFGVDDGQVLVAYAGSLGMSYQVEWVVRLAAALAPHGFDFRIAGDGATRALCAELAADLGLDPATVLLGKIARPTADDLIAAADIAVSSLIDEPALAHNSLNKVFDALALSTPVLFNHDGWLSDLVSGAGAGWSVAGRSMAETAELLVNLKSHPERLRVAGRNARELGESTFGRDRLFEEFEAAVTGGALAR